jgi:squalene-hopene/tetraprenyl-beta-curcumene cyclase
VSPFRAAMGMVDHSVMDESVKQAIATGADFLIDGQGPDGLWRDFQTPAGAASTWPTAYIGNALKRVGADRTVLDRAADAVVLRQQSDGGWGYNEETPSDADSTSWALLFLTSIGGHDNACHRARRCLAGHQRRRSGGVGTYARAGPIRQYMGLGRWVAFRGWCRPNVEVTAVAGRTDTGPGGGQVDRDAAWRYVRSRQNADGSWNAYWWASAHFATQQAAELALGVPDLDAVRRAAGWARRRQGSDGGWDSTGNGRASAFETALSLSVLAMAMSRLDDQRPLSRALDTLVGMQQPDGGWPTHPIMRIPVPADASHAADDRWRLVRFDGGIVVQDQHRLFTTATCVAALSRALGALQEG